MKILMVSLPLLILATGCDTPQRNRLTTSSTGTGLNFPSSTNTNAWTTGSGSSTTGSSTSGTTSTAVKPAGFEYCNLAVNQYVASGISRIGLCQSTLDETSFAIMPTVSESVRTCLIPTYRDASGNSTYLGQPQCFTPVANTVSQGILYKTRTGFTSNSVNGVMVMKEPSLTAYYVCMNAYVDFTNPSCQYGPQTNAYCDALAKSLMASKCNSFKADNSYIDIKLK